MQYYKIRNIWKGSCHSSQIHKFFLRKKNNIWYTRSLLHCEYISGEIISSYSILLILCIIVHEVRECWSVWRSLDFFILIPPTNVAALCQKYLRGHCIILEQRINILLKFKQFFSGSSSLWQPSTLRIKEEPLRHVLKSKNL